MTKSAKARSKPKAGTPASVSSKEQILIIEDEPEFLTWVEDYFASKNFDVVYAKNLSEAEQHIKRTPKYRLVIIDMNIPAPDGIDNATKLITPLAERYPGIAAAIRARSVGYQPHTVVLYTVYDDESISAVADNISCRYVLKGRPDVFKQVIEKSLLHVTT